MNAWNCCRMCLSESSLNPIFHMREHSSKYTEVVFNTTGVKMDPNDSLPQEMCTECIEQINSIQKFRKQCQATQETLAKQTIDTSTLIMKSEISKYTLIDITDYLDDKINETNDLTNTIDNNTDNESNITELDDADDKPLKLLLKRKNSRRKVGSNRKVNGAVKAKQKIKTKIEKKVKEDEKGEVKCEYCPKILTSKHSLRNHYKIHTGFDVVCEHCGKKFITKRLLLMHCRAKHGYEKTDKCSFCDYTASNAEQVKIHERLHTGERPFVCPDCNAGFHRKSSYLQHVAIHLPEKTVQCDQCPARFKSVTLMRIHRHRHRPPAYTFKCYICDSSFARRRNVLRHLSRIHALAEPTQPVERIKIS